MSEMKLQVPAGGWRDGDAVVEIRDGDMIPWQREPMGDEPSLWRRTDMALFPTRINDADMGRLLDLGRIVYIHAPRPVPAPVGGDVRDQVAQAIEEHATLSPSDAREAADAILARFDVTPRDGDTVRVPKFWIGALRNAFVRWEEGEDSSRVPVLDGPVYAPCPVHDGALAPDAPRTSFTERFAAAQQCPDCTTWGHRTTTRPTDEENEA